MFARLYPSTVILGIFGALLVAAVSLTAGIVVRLAIHPPEVTFAERWPAREIAAADPATREALIEYYRG